MPNPALRWSTLGAAAPDGRAHLYIESEVHHIALADDVVLSFEAQLSGFFRPRLAFIRNEIFVGDDFSTNESMLEIRMYHPGRLRRRGSRANGPRPNLFDSRREVGLQSQQGIRPANHAVESRLI